MFLCLMIALLTIVFLLYRKVTRKKSVSVEVEKMEKVERTGSQRKYLKTLRTMPIPSETRIAICISSDEEQTPRRHRRMIMSSTFLSDHSVDSNYASFRGIQLSAKDVYASFKGLTTGSSMCSELPVEGGCETPGGTFIIN